MHFSLFWILHTRIYMMHFVTNPFWKATSFNSCFIYLVFQTHKKGKLKRHTEQTYLLLFCSKLGFQTILIFWKLFLQTGWSINDLRKSLLTNLVLFRWENNIISRQTKVDLIVPFQTFQYSMKETCLNSTNLSVEILLFNSKSIRYKVNSNENQYIIA